MKKLVSILLVLLLLAFNVTAIAHGVITSASVSCVHPLGSNIVIGSAYCTASGTYDVLAKDIKITISLQKLVDGVYKTQTSKTNTGHATSLSCQATWTVSTGTYRIRAYFEAGDEEGAHTRYINSSSVTY